MATRVINLEEGLPRVENAIFKLKLELSTLKRSGVKNVKIIHGYGSGGSGGAIYMGLSGYFHIVNCNFVHNMANAYPAVFTMNPNMRVPDPGASATYNMT